MRWDQIGDSFLENANIKIELFWFVKAKIVKQLH